MEEIAKGRLAAVGIAFAGIAYFFVCAVPLPKDLVLVPVWARSAASLTASPSRSPAYPFRAGGRYGFFTADGGILLSAEAPFGVALADDAYAEYERLSEGFSIRAPTGAELGRTRAPGYPFFAAGRRFLIAPGQSAVSELAKDGALAWTYEFPSIVTAFGAAEGLAVFGLMDGSLVGLDRSGAALLDFAPGGSRIQCVYGVAVSPDARFVAAVTGLDKQRLVLLERRSSAYRVTYHRYLNSSYRRPLAMDFVAGGKYLLYETPGGAGMYDLAAGTESSAVSDSLLAMGSASIDGDIIVLLAGSGEEKRLVGIAPPDRRVFDLGYRSEDAFVRIEGRSMYLGVEGDLIRLDLEEK